MTPTYTFFDGYCSTVQGLHDWFEGSAALYTTGLRVCTTGLHDWFEVDLGFTELSFIQIDLCRFTYYPIHISRNSHIKELTYNGIHILRNLHTRELTYNGIHIHRNSHITEFTYKGIEIQRNDTKLHIHA